MTDNELCGRLGGDEFAVVIKDANDSKYVAILELINHGRKVWSWQEEHPFSSEVSIR
jgi:GGDEF domain-containing protein